MSGYPAGATPTTPPAPPPSVAARGRHPSTVGLLRFFDYEHLPEGPLRSTSRRCAALAADMVDRLPDGPELTTGLRKLLEAKDCFVRAALPARPEDGPPPG